MPIRPLSSEIQKVAETELNEVPSRVQDDLKHIREWLSKQPHIRARTDDQWLIAFLRGSKFSLERTKERLDIFYTMKSLTPELFSNRDPFLPEVQELLKIGAILVLPKTVHPGGPRTILFRTDIKDPDKVPLVTVFKVLGMILNIILLEDDNYVVGGVCAVGDVKNFSYKYMGQVTPELTKTVVIGAQDAYPTRIKGIHALNMPSYFMPLFHTFKLLINEKNRSRIYFHNGRNLKDLYSAVPLSILPKEYGGEGGSCVEIAAHWKKKVESYRDWYLEDSQYGTDETKRVGKPKTAASIYGLEGSFRKLDFD